MFKIWLASYINNFPLNVSVDHKFTAEHDAAPNVLINLTQ